MRTAFIISIGIFVMSTYFYQLAGFFVTQLESPAEGDSTQLLSIVHGLFFVVAVLSLLSSVVLGVLQLRKLKRWGVCVTRCV